MSHASIARHLSEMARSQPDTPALIVPSGGDYETITYRRLDADSDSIARGLTEVGIGKGVRTALFVTPGRDLFALFFGMFKCGAVPVLLDPGMGMKALKTCLDRVKPEAFIGVIKAHVARKLAGWAKGSVTKTVWVGPNFIPGCCTLEQVRRLGLVSGAPPLADVELDDTASIIFTSGSTGSPKGAVYTHRTFNAQVAMLKELYGIEPGEINLPTFPLFALFDPALGMTTVVPKMDFTKPGNVDPGEITGPIARFGVTNLFGSPALLRRVMLEFDPVDVDSLRRVISAGAPVPTDVLQTLREVIPPAAPVHTPYGSTEALPVATISDAEILGETAAKTRQGAGVCVGRPTPPNEVRIVRISDDAIETWSDDLVLPDGEIGEVCVRGPSVTLSYAEQPEKTQGAKIHDGETTWHRMGDVGYFDDQGRLWYCGRKKHRVVLADRTLFTIQIERIVDAPGLRTALVGVDGPNGREAALLWEQLGRDAPRTPVSAQVAALARERPEFAAIGHALQHPKFPVDPRHNAKIRRELLSAWAQRKLYG